VKELGWIFREQPVVDTGRCQIERLDNGNPTGRLLTVQIKTSGTPVQEAHDGFAYYGKLAHRKTISGKGQATSSPRVTVRPHMYETSGLATSAEQERNKK
jgi:Domain of unknown function (DUF4365)